MGVEVDRQADLLLQRLDEDLGRRGFQQARHVLQAQDMGAGRLQFLCAGDIVFQVIFRPRRVQEIAGIADRPFQHLAAIQHRIHRDAHVFDPIERIEHAEHVHPGGGGLFDKSLHHIVGVGGIAHAICPAQKHLGHQVRHGRAQIAQALPGAFLQEAIGHVKGRAAPAFDREQLRQVRGIGRRHADHVDRPHPGGQQALMPVAHRGVSQQHAGLRRHPVGHRLRALFVQQRARARRGGRGRRRRHRHPGGCRRARTARGFGMPVHRDVGDVGQDFRRPVAPLAEIEQPRRRVDELGRIGVVQERRVFQQVDDKVDVGADPADAEFAQGPVHPRDRLFGGLGLGRDLDQQRIIEPRDDPARIGRAAIKPDPHARRLAIGGDAAIVGDEVVLRILGRDAALQRVARQAHLGLACRARRLGQALALGHLDLGLHDVDAGHLLGHRVFDLHARVHLDEVEFAAVHIHQELDGAGAFVVHMGADAAAEVADLGALFVGQIGGGGAFDDLLVAPLHGAVAFIEVIDRPVLVAEDLHLDVAGALDHLFEVSLAIAERRLGLAPSLAHLGLKLVWPKDRAHAAPAAAPAGLEHQGIADRRRLGADRVEILAQNLGRGDHRHARGHRHAPRAGLVAQGAHGFGPRPDEGDARRIASLDEIRVFRQEPIARMDRVRAAGLGHPDDFRDREIGTHRAQALADQIGLVRLEAVQRQLVLLGIDRDGLFPQLVRRPHHADRDLAPVRHKDLSKVGHHRYPPGSEPRA